MEKRNSIHLNKELLQIMKKLINLGKKQHKTNHILYRNIRFDSLLLIPLVLLVNQKGTNKKGWVMINNSF